MDSTALASMLDPEDLRPVIRRYQETCVLIVERHGGFVARYAGDGIMVYFGYPQAHEEAAARACSAALEIAAAVTGMTIALPGRRRQAVSVRVGIATGLVIVGDLIGDHTAAEEAVVGETPNLAARIQTRAAPNSALIAAGTYALVRNRMQTKPLGEHAIKGFAEKQRLWQVIGKAGVASRFYATRGNIGARLVGREAELRRLGRAWARARQNQGRVILLSGEAGIGKSKLIDTLQKKIGMAARRAGDVDSHFYQCSQFHQNTPFFPFLARLEDLAARRRAGSGDSGDGSVADKTDNPEQFLAALSGNYAAVAPLYAAGAAWATASARETREARGVREEPPPMPPGRRETRERCHGSVLTQIECLPDDTPLLIVLEDIHWIDPGSMDLVGRIIPQVAGRPILFIISGRPEFAPPARWLGQGHVRRMPLENLDDAATRMLMTNLVRGRRLSPTLMETIAERADGIPLYIEELVSAMLERDGGRGARPGLPVPASLQDSLMARLDQNPEAKHVAQLASALGRDFSQALILAVSAISRERLDAGLRQLRKSGILEKTGRDDGNQYRFRHALIRDAAYESLLKSRRRALHLRALAALQERFPDIAAARPEELEYHRAQAGLLGDEARADGAAASGATGPTG